MPNTPLPLDALRSHLSPEEWLRRTAEADRQAAIATRIEAREAIGESERSAIRAEAPGDPETTWVKRLKQFRRGGRDALVSRRLPAAPPRKVTERVAGIVGGILAMAPETRAPQVRERLLTLGVALSETTVKRIMKRLGLGHAPGAPPRRRRTAEPVPLAGAELLLAVDHELGATARMVSMLEAAMEGLSPSVESVEDDRANRDDHGRFLPGYNAGQERGAAEVGRRFRSTEETSRHKDLRALRTANSSTASLRRKVLAMVMLPVVTDAPRWSALAHWQGEHLGGIAGYAYRPATLDKFARELKHTHMSEALRASVADFWLDGPRPVDAVTGMALTFADVTVKPLWTHAFSRSAKVAKLGGRIMPATSTLFLHTGTGTPVVYRSWSGTASMVREVGALLSQYEEAAGPGTVRRLVVMDREAHAVSLFKELSQRDHGWEFIIPLRGQVVGPKAAFEELTPWVDFGGAGDEVRGGWLVLRDSKAGAEPLRVRVVGRRRHRTGKVGWYATLVDAESVPDADVLRLYFARWPRQEHVFRDAAGRVHLDVHHGYGKRSIENVAVLDRLDRIDAALRRAKAGLARLQAEIDEQKSLLDGAVAAGREAEGRLKELRASLDRAVAGDNTRSEEFRQSWQLARREEAQLPRHRAKVAKAAARLGTAHARVVDDRQRITALEAERTSAARHRQIMTIDVELDQILTAFKLTFLNLCEELRNRYLGGRRMEIDTLIRGILTLPGERVITQHVETIRIWRQPRDLPRMKIVEEACRAITARQLIRNERLLRFEVGEPTVERPPGRTCDPAGGSIA